MTADEYEVSFGGGENVRKCSKIRLPCWLHNAVNMLKKIQRDSATQAYKAHIVILILIRGVLFGDNWVSSINGI